MHDPAGYRVLRALAFSLIITAEQRMQLCNIRFSVQLCAGHTNVFYVGDRVKRRGELNGKSANMNHAIMNKIFPGVRSPADVSAQEVILVMDCDHMVKPDIFDKMAPCMLDESLAVLLAPQRFHNVIQPDFFDTANSDFMVGKMPYRFGAGMCYITGTPPPQQC